MIYLLNWFLVLVLLALWSALVWAAHALASWALSNAGALPDASAGAAALRLPDWLVPWVPPELVELGPAVLATLGPVVDWLVQVLPSVSGVLTVAAWLVWGLVAALLLVMGVALHAAIAWWRRNGANGAGRLRAALRQGA